MGRPQDRDLATFRAHLGFSNRDEEGRALLPNGFNLQRIGRTLSTGYAKSPEIPILTAIYLFRERVADYCRRPPEA